MFLASANTSEHADSAHASAQQLGAAHAAGEHAAGHGDKLDPLHHIFNSEYWTLTDSWRWNISESLHIPPIKIGGLNIDLSPSLHVIMLWIAALLVFLVLRAAAKREEENVPRGRLRNFFESIIVFLRDEVVYAIMGPEVGRRYLPFLLTTFFFILFANLLGLIPPMATATGNINVTASLAIITFIATQVGGIRNNGFIAHWRALVPPGVPLPLIPIMIPIEIMGMFTKPFALTVRLFANMIAGHIIILSFFGMIFGMTGVSLILFPLPFAGAVAISAFEIFVGFLQAFIFMFLSTIFIYQAVHPEH